MQRNQFSYVEFCVGSFPEQRLVIEPILYLSSVLQLYIQNYLKISASNEKEINKERQFINVDRIIFLVSFKSFEMII